MSYPKYNEDNRKNLQNQRPHDSLNKHKEDREERIRYPQTKKNINGKTCSISHK